MGLVVGKYISCYSFFAEPEFSDGVLVLGGVGRIEMVCTSSAICPEKRDGVFGVATVRGRLCVNLFRGMSI